MQACRPVWKIWNFQNMTWKVWKASILSRQRSTECYWTRLSKEKFEKLLICQTDLEFPIAFLRFEPHIWFSVRDCQSAYMALVAIGTEIDDSLGNFLHNANPTKMFILQNCRYLEANSYRDLRQRDIMIQSSRFLALSRLSDELNLKPGQENRKY